VTPAIGIGELLDYSDHERRKWRAWLAADPARMAIAVQPGGRFPTIEAMFDHIFLVERRHLARLEGGVPPDATGVAPDDLEALFEYADLVRSSLRNYVAEATEDDLRATMTFVTQSGTGTMTRRRLLAHIVLHEIRHLAQVAHAARAAGQAPPGQHDLFYCPEVAG
jgi:uncharacterized damage-inducible protein DinB